RVVVAAKQSLSQPVDDRLAMPGLADLLDERCGHLVDLRRALLRGQHALGVGEAGFDSADDGFAGANGFDRLPDLVVSTIARRSVVASRAVFKGGEDR